jgi:hypothetical protein
MLLSEDPRLRVGLVCLRRRRVRIQIEFQAADAKISDGTWRKYFPGKEIYRQIQSHIYDRNPAQRKPNKTERDIAPANSIAQSQLDRDVVSQDLIQLFKAFLSRVGLESNESRRKTPLE